MVSEAFARDLKLLLGSISPPGQNPLADIAVAFGGGMQGVDQQGKGWGKPERRWRQAYYGIVAIGVALYLMLSISDAWVECPYQDEGYFASASYSLVAQGRMGTPIIVSEGTPLVRLASHTYWVMPLYLLVQAAWFKVVGYTLLASRSISVLAGLGVLSGMFVLVWKLAHDPIPAALSVLLLGIDFNFVNVASLARMDMLTAAFGFGALGSYLLLRERNVSWAVFASQSLVVCSGMTHPNGAIHAVGLLFLTLYLDARRIRPRHLLIAALPYLVAAGAWALFISRDVEAFHSQFAFNASLGGRFNGFVHPLAALRQELVEQYGGAFGFASGESHFKSHFKLVVLGAYFAGVATLLALRPLRKQRGEGALLWLALGYFLMQTLFNQKVWVYLVHILPLYAAILAVVFCGVWDRRLMPRVVVAAPLLALCLFQIVGAAYQFRGKLNRRTAYERTVAFIKSREGPNALVVGDAAFGFDLGLGGQLMDAAMALRTGAQTQASASLGCVGGRRVNMVVIDGHYEEELNYIQRHWPNEGATISRELEDRFHLIYDQHPYKVYSAREDVLNIECGGGAAKDALIRDGLETTRDLSQNSARTGGSHLSFIPKSGVNFAAFMQISCKIEGWSRNLCSGRSVFGKVGSAFQRF